VTDRTALMLVDINRSQLTILGEIRDIIKRTNGIGGGGPQITIINHFGADVGQEIADKIIDELEEKLDARNGGRLNLQHIHTGMVGR
jgi:hypothetical protein